MYGTNVINKNITITKVLDSLSKGLNIANQFIPIYKEAKPIINNTKKLFSLIKNTPKNIINNNSNSQKKEVNLSKYTSKPIFFQ